MARSTLMTVLLVILSILLPPLAGERPRPGRAGVAAGNCSGLDSQRAWPERPLRDPRPLARPSAVFVDEPKVNDEFFISILLTIFFWLPGIIHAFW